MRMMCGSGSALAPSAEVCLAPPPGGGHHVRAAAACTRRAPRFRDGGVTSVHHPYYRGGARHATQRVTTGAPGRVPDHHGGSPSRLLGRCGRQGGTAGRRARSRFCPWRTTNNRHWLRLRPDHVVPCYSRLLRMSCAGRLIAWRRVSQLRRRRSDGRLDGVPLRAQLAMPPHGMERKIRRRPVRIDMSAAAGHLAGTPGRLHDRALGRSNYRFFFFSA